MFLNGFNKLNLETNPLVVNRLVKINKMDPIPSGSLNNLNTRCIEDSRKDVAFPNMCRVMSCLYCLGFRLFRI